jgi:predicted secreted acid phosphatase
MSRLARFWTGAVLTASLACASASSNAPRVQPSEGRASASAQPCASPPSLYEAQQQVEDYIRSGRYDADVARVAAEAQRWLETSAGTVKKPAIVLDIDETSLSNWRAYRLNGWGRITAGTCDLKQGPCGLRAWQALGEATALAPTLALARRARELNVAVFFISGRPPNLRDATERNLKAQGYEWDRVILLPEGANFASAVDFKAPERKKLSDEGFTILLSMGDQDSDLKGGYAQKTFKLPNPVYFLP